MISSSAVRWSPNIEAACWPASMRRPYAVSPSEPGWGTRLETYRGRSVANQWGCVACGARDLWNRRGECRPGAALAPSSAAARWCNRYARFCTSAGPACADALSRRAQISDVARLTVISRVTRSSRSDGAAKARWNRQYGRSQAWVPERFLGEGSASKQPAFCRWPNRQQTKNI